ncbi:hypothetical protein FOTG_16251 [Fusarium oxysporum f. sp. vasinfectum 25433]|uniref:Uncharacterized protein n=1 Tax=Fusarium oxysporum f. sp. vasinfectum 25433 TaxID=1089449 RepID=X0L374_FUSOX|nr:hypothetical protein FOTG_16251 [Fusarium oxysporum f. sp. vasinfectum 25433]
MVLFTRFFGSIFQAVNPLTGPTPGPCQVPPERGRHDLHGLRN